MPNAFAYLALFSFPLVALVLFRTLKVPTAVVWTILLGYLFLPSLPQFDLPGMPNLSKDTMTAACALVLCLLADRRDKQLLAIRLMREARAAGKRLLPQDIAKTIRPEYRKFVRRIIIALLVMALVGPILTVLSNGDPVFGGAEGPRPALGIKDVILGFNSAFFALIPFFLARRFLAGPEGHVTILKAFCILGFIYSLLVLYEARMSPQLNVHIYGFFPRSFMQHMRGGSWRAIVFLHHGLWVGVVMSATILSAMTMMKHSTGGARLTYLLLVLWMIPVLILGKNFAALIIGMIGTPFILIATRRTQIIVAAVIAAILLSYPMMRGAGLIPTDKIYEKVAAIDPDRAQSLSLRFKNEDQLSEKASRRPLFGWGGWGRSRVFDPVTGKDISITDGLWVILIGTSGWFGYIAKFGLLCIPILFLAFRRREELDTVTTGLTIVLGANLIDMMLNATLTPHTWLIAGALAGYAERAPVQVPDESAGKPLARPPSRFSRTPAVARQRSAN